MTKIEWNDNARMAYRLGVWAMGGLFSAFLSFVDFTGLLPLTRGGFLGYALMFTVVYVWVEWRHR